MLKPERNPLCVASCLIKRYEAKNTQWQLRISQLRQMKIDLTKVLRKAFVQQYVSAGHKGMSFHSLS